MFDESTYTANEMFIKNWGYIMETYYADYLNDDLVLRGGGDSTRGWRTELISTKDDPDNYRTCYFFNDGTYVMAERSGVHCICPACGEIDFLYNPFGEQIHTVSDVEYRVNYALHKDTYWLFELTDGRTMRAEMVDGNKVFTFLDEAETNA